jgi:hypothetical protein
MPQSRSIPTGQVQFTAERYIQLLSERGKRIPRALSQIAKIATTDTAVLLECIKKLELLGLTNQTDYLKIRTAARIRVLRGSGNSRSDYGAHEANKQRLRRAASQVVWADKLLMDILNRYPCLSTPEYRLMLKQMDQTNRFNQP